MSFEDQLRKTMSQIDYSDRDKLLRNTAKGAVRSFRENCMMFARMGKSFYSLSACENEPGKTYSVYFYKDEDYEAAKARGTPLPHMGEHIFLKLSEADKFMEYLREELSAQDMASTHVRLEEDISTLPKQGLFGVRKVRCSNNRYQVFLSMSW